MSLQKPPSEARVSESPWSEVDDSALAALVADDAGRALLALRDELDEPSGSESLREQADRLANRVIVGLLHQWRPDDAILSEEAPDDLRRIDADRVWIVDPLDGTREYAERAETGWRDDWAVHVALWTRAAGAAIGAVSMPARGVTFATARPPVAPAGPEWGSRPLRLAVSRSHPAPIVDYLKANLDAEFVAMGSAGVKAMAVVTGEVDAYVHDGGQFEWDSAAPVAVATAAGCVARRLDGSALHYNLPNPWLPDLVVSAPSIAAELGRLLASAGASTGRVLK
jgi:3'(2'), 5'-bisphosphate nucleotidase